MVVSNFRTKARANRFASRRRRMGYNASVFKKEVGWGVSVTRK